MKRHTNPDPNTIQIVSREGGKRDRFSNKNLYITPIQLKKYHNRHVPVMTRFLSILLLLGSILVLPLSPVHAGVNVYPPFLFINAPNRSVAVTVTNPDDTRREIWVDFRYGYPVVNDSGAFEMVYIENPSPQDPSAVAWSQAYPQRFVLEPGESQVVRVMVQPPVGVPSGEYWTRVVVSSKEVGSRTPQTPGEGFKMKWNLVTQVDLPLHVRTGGVKTGLRIHGIASAVEQGTLRMGIDFERFGNASYWGTLNVSLKDENHKVVASYKHTIAVYTNMVYPVSVELTDVAPGIYTVEVNVETKRSGVPAKFRVDADPVRYSGQVTIP